MVEQTKQFQESYPEGSFEVSILDYIFEEKKSGNICLKIKVSVVKMEKTKNGSPVPSNLILGGHRFVELYFTEKTKDETKAFLNAAGWRGNDVRELDTRNGKHVKLAGFAFKASNKPEIYKGENDKYRGKMMDRFQAYPIGGGNNKWMENIKAVSQTRLLGLNALWNSQNSGVSATQHVQQASSEPAPFAPDNAEMATDASFNWD